MEINVLWAIVFSTVAAVEFFMLLRMRVRTIRAGRVDEYSLSVEERDGFHFVQLKFQTDAGAATFDLDPNYSHVLSDELLTASAKAIRSAHAPTR